MTAETKKITKTATAAPKKRAVRTPKPKTTPKPELSSVTTPAPLTADTLIKVWFDGWKKTLHLQGRSSRFELWAFMLLNSLLTVVIELKCAYYFTPRFLRQANAAGYSLDKIDHYITTAEIVFYLCIFIPLFPIGSLLVRRMHDLGKLAWQNCLEPIFMGTVVLSMLLLALNELNDTDYAYTALMLSICFVTMLYSVGFYSLKFLIQTMFYRGDTQANEYGKALYKTDTDENRALNLSCFYFLFILTIGVLYLATALI